MRYIILWFEFLKNNFKKETIFSANFFLQFFGHLLWFFCSIIFFTLIYCYTDEIGGWNRWNTLCLLSINQIVILIYESIFGMNLRKFPEYIEEGLLDTMLILPCDIQFIASTRFINFRALFSLPFPIFLLLYSLHKWNIFLSIKYIFLFLLFLFLAVILRYTLGFLIMSLSFWLVRISSLYALYDEFAKYAAYPESIFSKFSKFLFTFVFPLILLANFPLNVLLGYLNYETITKVLLVLLFFVFISRIAFIRAIKFYYGASS